MRPRKTWSAKGEKPRLSSRRMDRERSSRRRTTFSPQMVSMVPTRMSSGQPATGNPGLKGLLEGTNVPVDAGTQLVGLRDRLVDFRTNAEQRLNPLTGQHLELGKQAEVTWIDSGDLELILVDVDRQDGVLTRVGFRDQGQRILFDAGPRKIDQRNIEVLAEYTRKRFLLDHALAEQDLPERLPLPFLLGEGSVELFGGEQAVLEKELAQPLFLAKAEAPARLPLDGAHATSRRGAGWSFRV